MKKKLHFLSGLLFLTWVAHAQFAPPAGISGSTALYKDSAVFTSWASACIITRGLQDISSPTSGYASVGNESLALGKAGSNGVLSLGDGGIADLTFAASIANGPGDDFAVFENGFDEFLELAFVEVSSDGTHYVRFPASSLTPHDKQVGAFDPLDAAKINNLAGKYVANYGTPFDLEELKDKANLDVNHVSHVRIIDVVGCIQDAYATHDHLGNKVNDPWPTAFPSGGFDLDAVGVIHSTVTSLEGIISKAIPEIYPSALSQGNEVNIHLPEVPSMETFLLMADVRGSVKKNIPLLQQHTSFATTDIPPGLYTLQLINKEGFLAMRKIIITD